MALDSTAAKEAQQIAEAEKITAEAKLAKAKAEAELAAYDVISKANQDKALAEAEAAVLAKKQAAATAETAAIAAEQANIKSKFGTVTANTMTSGDVTAGTNAGSLEANLLSALAIDKMGKKIAADLIKPIENPKGYVIFTGTEKPSFTNLSVFDLRYNVIMNVFNKAEGGSNAADLALAQLDGLAPIKTTGANEAVTDAITGAGVLLDSMSKIASYFQTSYTVAKLDITGSDDSLLAASVASGLSEAYLPGRWLSPAKSGASKKIDSLSIRRTNSAGTLAVAKGHLKELQDRASKEKSKVKKAAIDQVAAAYERAIASHELAQKTFDDFLAALITPDATGASPISKIVDEDFTSSKILDGASSVFLHVHAATGASYTKKNLWTFFGRMPFFVAGGAVVSYIVINSDGKIVKSGQLQAHGGYLKPSEVSTTFDINKL